MNEDFLAFAKAGRRGRLKVFLGMAAGVGKTVAMLREGRRLKADGLDVAIGVVLTHGRAETERELEGLERLPQRVLEYRGVPLEEMDLDAVVARKPDVALVDELAHTNVPGSRHDKRWKDVEWLCAQGIAVLTTVNIQHLESLHDLVLRETGIDVRERVPDRIVQQAEDVVVVDVPPAELRERLRSGKVYPSHKVEQALSGFFREENLAALRQIALREVANAVEARVEALESLTGHERAVAAAERVMVCMSSRPTGATQLLRRGARLAGGPNDKWFVVYVRTPHESTERIDAATLRTVTENINLAKELGADIVQLEGTDVPQLLTEFARARRITHAIFGRTRLSAVRERLFGSVLDKFMRLCPEVDVLVVGVPRGVVVRALILERDESGRGMMDRVLSGMGVDCLGAASAEEVAAPLDRGEFQLAIVDELAGTGASLEEVRTVRRRWPGLPVIVTGSVLSSRVLLELMRLGALEALPKPFSPSELREVVARVIARAAPAEDESLEYAAAIRVAREALGAGAWDKAEVHLRRALRIAPLEPEAVALLAVREEALGHDARAAQLYRAAWVLGDDESIAPPDPREGLARLQLFADAKVVPVLGSVKTARLVDDWSEVGELEGEELVIGTIGLVHRVDAALILRASDKRSFALSLGDDTPETWAYLLDRLGVEHVHVSPETRARLDLPRLSSLRRSEAS